MIRTGSILLPNWISLLKKNVHFWKYTSNFILLDNHKWCSFKSYSLNLKTWTLSNKNTPFWWWWIWEMFKWWGTFPQKLKVYEEVCSSCTVQGFVWLLISAWNEQNQLSSTARDFSRSAKLNQPWIIELEQALRPHRLSISTNMFLISPCGIKA